MKIFFFLLNYFSFVFDNSWIKIFLNGGDKKNFFYKPKKFLIKSFLIKKKLIILKKIHLIEKKCT